MAPAEDGGQAVSLDPWEEVVAVFALRNLGGISLLAFGSTFLWLTPEFASRGVSTSTVWWSISRVLALVTLVGFTVATWGLSSAVAGG